MNLSNAKKNICISTVSDDSAAVDALAEITLDCVRGGASIGFMDPPSRDRVVSFWRDALASAARGERIVLIAKELETDAIVGTVQVVLANPENQPHRADVAKMQVHRNARRRGIGSKLMQAAELAARDAGRTLLVLDTATGSGAEQLYEKLGWKKCGVIPGYALWPQGGCCSATIFYRELA